jgi:chromosome segregation and condensation protein ScpB
MNEKSKIWLETKKFLEKHGLDSLGQKKSTQDKDQRAFERRLILTPCGGKVKS